MRDRKMEPACGSGGFVAQCACVASLCAVFTVLVALDKLAFDPYSDFSLVKLGRILVTSVNWALLLLAPCPLFGRWGKWAYFPLAVLIFTSDGIQWYCRLNHGMILDGDWIGIALCSSRDEIMTYLRCAFSWKLAWGLMGFAVGGALLAKAFQVIPKGGLSARSALLSFAMLLVGGAFFSLKTPDFWTSAESLRTLVCTNLIVDSVEKRSQFVNLCRLATSPQIGGAPQASAAGRMVGVFVLGESATRNRWGLYGYPRATTPCMDAIRDELVAFSNLVAAAWNTAEAMRLLLTEASLDCPDDMRCTLPQVLSRAGWDCRHFSAQERWGEHDGMESFVFAGCSQLHFMSEEMAGRVWHDDALLDCVDRALTEPGDRPLVIFLHLRGSHFPPGDNCPQEFSPFPRELAVGDARGVPAANVNNYDNTIAFTDRLLGQVVERLKRLDRPAWMLYLSDHGDSVDSPRFRTATDLNLWEVPMVFWASERYRASHVALMETATRLTDAPLQSDLLFATVLRLCDVQGYASARPETSFEAAPFGFRKVRKIVNGSCTYERKGQ